ncbi:hypothetical protein BKA56DRAFT_625333 [Ilyonectria sp. MPI-CAGE-AT-0026]|nr:hypothetical protein BKA56DRAFT_625333 [Ilyonectria sp. MPI-CAGE-AT-0026]
MADRRGAYVLVSDNETSYTDTSIDDRLCKAFTFLAGTLQPVRQKRRILFLLGGAALVFLTIFIHQTTLRTALSQSQPFKHLDAVHLGHLAASLTGHELSSIDNETTFIVGEHHTVSGNYPDDYQWIDPYSRQPFVEIMDTNGMNNNAMGRMSAASIKFNPLLLVLEPAC